MEQTELQTLASREATYYVNFRAGQSAKKSYEVKEGYRTGYLDGYAFAVAEIKNLQEQLNILQAKGNSMMDKDTNVGTF